MLFDFGCCSLAQEMNFVDCYPPYFRQWLTVGPSAFPAFVYWKFAWRSAPCPSSFLPCDFSNSAPLLCVSFQFLVYCSVVVFFFGVGGSVCPGGYAGLSQGWLGNIGWCLLLTCLDSQMSPKQVWSQHLAAPGALLFSQCKVAWRSFVWARSSGCLSFDSPWLFISAKCGSSISARFLIHGAHAVCFCTLVAILDLIWC
jgi:hypothetical protein